MPDSTPKLRIPYPLPGDAVTDYPTTGRELAERLDALIVGVVVPVRTVIAIAGSGTYNTPAGALALLVEAIGGGGSTPAAAINPTNAGGSPGAGGGAYAETLILAPGPTYPLVVATAGGATGFGPSGAELCKASGGATPGAVSSAAFNRYAGGSGGKAATSIGDVKLDGHDGDTFVILSATQALPAFGGGAARGGGLVRPAFAGNVSNGVPGNTPGGGAAGSHVLSSGTSAGANGAPGLLVVTAWVPPAAAAAALSFDELVTDWVPAPPLELPPVEYPEPDPPAEFA